MCARTGQNATIPTQVEAPELHADKAVTDAAETAADGEEEAASQSSELSKNDFWNPDSPWKCLEGKVPLLRTELASSQPRSFPHTVDNTAAGDANCRGGRQQRVVAVATLRSGLGVDVASDERLNLRVRAPATHPDNATTVCCDDHVSWWLAVILRAQRGGGTSFRGKSCRQWTCPTTAL